MSLAEQLGFQLNGTFNDPKCGIFAVFAVATDGLTAAQAASIPGPRLNSIWAIVNHLWYWNEYPLRVLRGESMEPGELGAPDGSGWPPAGDPGDEAAWRAARARAIEANQRLAAVVGAMSEEQAQREIEGWGTPPNIALVTIAHNSYHTGEIITVRHMQGLWVDSKHV